MRIASIAFLLVTAAATLVMANESQEKLEKLLADEWEFQLSESPVFATRMGVHRWDDQLSDESLANQDRRARQKRRFLRRWEAIDRNQLVGTARVNYDIFGRLLKDEIAEFKYGMHLIPITNRSGFHISFAELPRQVRFKSVEDYENYLARLRAFSKYSSNHIALLREGINKQLVLPSAVLEGYQDSISAHIVADPTNSLLYGPLQRFPEHISDSDRSRLCEQAAEAIAEHVVPGYEAFLRFMTSEYLPACRGSIGASALPQGREFYRHRVRKFTTLDLTPEEVHETGVSEVARIRAEMEEIIEKVKFDGDFASFLRFLREDPRFYAETPEQLQKEISYVLKRMDGALPRLFGVLPRTPYGIRVVPEYIAPKTTTAYYQPPSGDGSQAGFYYINTYNLKARPLYGIEALSLHEAVPGHHLQIALQQELSDLPEFRRFAGITAFIEGWGLYAERLGLEVGFYEDPYSDFGRLTYEMWRACRLVVDTGMHYLGWTRQRAIQYMADNTALSLHNIEAEVDRYISWPGQALAYKTGELKIRQLRRIAEEQLGDRFDIRRFHDVVLGSGAVPLAVLEENVREYLERERRE
jgi:uncharacterized protein (DUF885 family)